MSFEDKITLLLEEAVEEADRLEFTDDSARYCSFIQYVAQFTEHLTERAMAEAIVSFPRNSSRVFPPPLFSRFHVSNYGGLMRR